MADGPYDLTVPTLVMADALKMTTRRLQQMARDGIVPRAAPGRYHLIATTQAYISYLRDRTIGGDKPEEQGPDARQRMQEAKADIATMEADRLRESLIPASQISAVMNNIAELVKQQILATVPKVAPMVAPEMNVNACAEILTTFLAEALADLASLESEIRAAPDMG